LHCLTTFVMVGRFVAIALYLFSYKIGNRLYLNMTASLAYDKKICHRFGYFPQVQTDNMLPFFLLDGLYDGFEDLTAPG
jgi:hypothetical protein